jgi:site-specific recombinase XerD
LDITPWIADYETFMHCNAYASRAIEDRLKHLACFNSFIDARGLEFLEQFGPELESDFVDYWIHHRSMCQKSGSFPSKSRFNPRHNRNVQFSLRSFLRWAHAAGRLQQNAFPLRPSVQRSYFFSEVADYLLFCREHKGLAKNSLRQVELFVSRFDQFLHSEGMDSWDRLDIRFIDTFIRQQASRNKKRIQLIHAVLRGLLRYLFSLGILDRDWACTLRSPRRYALAHTPRTMTVDQVLRLLRSIDRNHRGGKRDLAIVLMAASLGVRASEIAALSLENFNWPQAVVSFPPVKGKNVLLLPLSCPLIEALVDYLKNERPVHSPCRNVFLRLTPPLGPLTASAVSKLMGQRMQRASIAGKGHWLRHAFSHELLKSGIAFSTLQQLLGHSCWSSTQVYTKIDLTQLREVDDNDAENM